MSNLIPRDMIEAARLRDVLSGLANGLSVVDACKQAGITPPTFREYCSRYPDVTDEFAAVMKIAQQNAIGVIQSAMEEAATILAERMRDRNTSTRDLIAIMNWASKQEQTEVQPVDAAKSFLDGVGKMLKNQASRQTSETPDVVDGKVVS